VTSYALLQTQKNEVAKVLERVGFTLSDFEWIEEPYYENQRSTMSRLIHKPSKYWCYFEYEGDGFWRVIFSPAADERLGACPKVNPFSGILGAVERWAGYLKREITAPDLWKALPAEVELSQAAWGAEGSNELFTPEEKTALVDRLKGVEAHVINTYRLADNAREEFRTRMVYLQRAVDRLGKRDWLGIAYSAVISWAVGSALPPEVARPMLKDFFGRIFGFLGGLIGWKGGA
jgi:hypothetical protein